MFRHSISKIRAIPSNLLVSNCLRCSTRNPLENLTFGHAGQRLFVSSAQESTVGDVIDQWSRRFETEGVPEPVKSIQHIVAHVLGTRKVPDILNVTSERLKGEQIKKLQLLCENRLSRMPIQYIVGEWDFGDITLKLVPPILVPWPETEMFVDYVIKRLKSFQLDGCEMLEIGCGSGAIILALAHACKEIRCTAIDVNPHACELTMINRERLNLTDRVAVVEATLMPDARIELTGGSHGIADVDLNTRQFDFVVSNPPYVSTKKLLELQPEMKTYQDPRALNGGDDGLQIIKLVLRHAAKVLKPGGHLFMEVDIEHPEQIQLFTNKYTELKLRHMHTYKYDDNGRFVEIMKTA